MSELDCRAIEERLPWYLSGGLAPEQSQAIATHLERCAACARALAATREASAIYNAHPAAETLVDYALGLDFSEVSRSTLELHLAHCAQCREELALAAADATPAARYTGAPRPSATFARQARRGPSGREFAMAAALIAALGLGLWALVREPGAAAIGRVALVELAPAGERTRGPEGAAVSIRRSLAATLLLSHDRGEPIAAARAQVERPGDAALLLSADGLLPYAGGAAFTLGVPAEALPVGEFAIVLEGQIKGKWLRLATYRLRVEP